MAGNADEESQLIGRARGGDREAFRLLHEAHREAAYRVAWRLLGNREDALDVVQDAFVRAYENLSSFAGQSSFRSWLLRIVNNRAIDWRRARRLRKGVSLSTADEEQGPGGNRRVPAVDDPPDRSLQQQELEEALRRAMDRLPEESRSVLALYAGGQMSYREIADSLGIPIGTVMSRLYHARRRLREALKPWLDTDASRQDETMP